MNDSEIIKGLERLSTEDPNGFSADILELISYYKAEIERLNKVRRKQALFLALFLSEERAQKYDLIGKLSQAKSEAYKDFAAQLKQHARKMRGYDLCEAFWDYAVLVEDIDSILKEMIKRLAGEED